VSRVIDEHRLYLSDRERLCAYERALAETIHPGDVVVDLASGTGILGMLACRAGAARVYAIEADGIAGLAREIARANGLGDRIVVVKEHSTLAALPERADVLVSDQIGRFGLEASIVELFADARRRLLKPDARLVPGAIDLFVAPVQSPRLHRRLHFWSRRPAGFEYAPAGAVAANTGYPARYTPEQILGPASRLMTVDLSGDVADTLTARTSLRAAASGSLHGIGGWFSARLSPTVTMTNAPGAAHRIRRRQVFFPIDRAVAIAEGDEVEVRMQFRPADLLYAWEVTVRPGSASPIAFRHSTLAGMLIDPADVRRTAPGYRPRLTPRGVARLTVLSLCDGVRPLTEIEAAVRARHADLFASEAEAAAFVAEVVTRYSNDAD
jgi:Arginine methyltransferase oligomerization subdomain/Ribosomal protein L11 methyltransferase (PrmA)